MTLTPDFLALSVDDGGGGMDEKVLEGWRSHQVGPQVDQPLKSTFNTQNQRTDTNLKATFSLIKWKIGVTSPWQPGTGCISGSRTRQVGPTRKR